VDLLLTIATWTVFDPSFAKSDVTMRSLLNSGLGFSRFKRSITRLTLRDGSNPAHEDATEKRSDPKGQGFAQNFFPSRRRAFLGRSQHTDFFVGPRCGD
jgi:hypothetical protein